MLHLSMDKLYLQLNEDLEAIDKNESDPLKRMVSAVSKIRDSLDNLKLLIVNNPFSGITEEIHFFKHIKPKFSSKLIYQIESYKINSAKPCGILETLKAYYEKELIFMERFFRQNQFQYEYYRQGMVELDSIYFVRGAEVQTGIYPDIPDLQPDFSTSCDYIFSKFIAYEALQIHILRELDKLNSPGIYLPENKKELPELKWTGDKVNLVEVIYGLYFTGQLNHGNADLSVIIRFMEKSLQIDLSRSYRDFIDIRNRKRSSPTRYIDEMRESINKKVDEDLAVKNPRRTNINADLK